VWCYVRVAGNSECGRVAVRNRAGRGDGDFDPAWLAKRGWQVVPVETERSHLSDQEIDRVVPVLNKAGHLEGLAVATEETSSATRMLSDRSRSWAVSSHGFYRLFAGTTEMLESFLGTFIPVARKAFHEFALSLDSPSFPDKYYLQVSARYQQP